ncbi:hypothetical protein QM480_01845 [Flectobacillus sp. DC10W]|uniref:Uncharacterized protein n=1 Tax=Flectobacillus longus TaxID=2984207 RepID=A0ABT6YI08_9BACT|nr:hypothetical protein [Flectobacillus longus]MDI9863052.1 hypothetical protein [Flectobacillus longus]
MKTYIVCKMSNVGPMRTVLNKEHVDETIFFEKVKEALVNIFEGDTIEAEKAFPSVKQHLATRPGLLEINEVGFEIVDNTHRLNKTSEYHERAIINKI